MPSPEVSQGSNERGAIAPRLVSEAAQAAFEVQARKMGLDPANVWIGGYVDYEWNRLRPILAAYGITVAGQRVLEFGSNVGASSVVFSLDGARVQGVDVAAEYIELARANAARYGREDIAFLHVPDTRQLPFEDGCFDLIACNSVLEYVHPDQLAEIQRELDRVLKPGGLILVTGTSSRLWPRETHSQRWFTNYLPRFIDPWIAGATGLTRGVSPWAIRYGFGPGYRNLDQEDGGQAFIKARAAMKPRYDTAAHRTIAWIAARIGVGPGLLMNNISCVLRKAGPEA